MSQRPEAPTTTQDPAARRQDAGHSDGQPGLSELREAVTSLALEVVQLRHRVEVLERHARVPE